MTEYDYWKIFPRMPKKVTVGDITIRDGFQHLEKFISTRAKIFYLEQLIFAGCRNIEVTNLGNPFLMPQFSDAEELLAHLRSERFKKRCQVGAYLDPDVHGGESFNKVCQIWIQFRRTTGYIDSSGV